MASITSLSAATLGPGSGMLSMETDFLMELGVEVIIGLAFIILLMMGELATWETSQSGLICHLSY